MLTSGLTQTANETRGEFENRSNQYALEQLVGWRNGLSNVKVESFQPVSVDLSTDIRTFRNNLNEQDKQLFLTLQKENLISVKC